MLERLDKLGIKPTQPQFKLELKLGLSLAKIFLKTISSTDYLSKLSTSRILAILSSNI